MDPEMNCALARQKTNQVFDQLAKQRKDETIKEWKGLDENAVTWLNRISNSYDYYEFMEQNTPILNEIKVFFKAHEKSGDDVFQKNIIALRDKMIKKLKQIDEDEILSVSKLSISDPEMSRIPRNQNHQSVMMKKVKSSFIKVPQNPRALPQKLQVQAKVRFFSSKINYNYEYEGHKLIEKMKKYINDYLENNDVMVSKTSDFVKILGEIEYIKSKDAGNYSFDPFCGAVEIRLFRKDGKPFQKTFKTAKQVKVTPEEIKDLKEWNKNLNLSPKDKIGQLINYIGEKRQEDKKVCERFEMSFRLNGGAQRILDILNWSKEDYQKMSLKTSWIYQIIELVDIIKDMNSDMIPSNKKIGQEKEECIKVANSHKILRYLIYKIDGLQKLNDVGPLNYKNMKKAIDIVKRQIINDELLNQLQKYFFQFTVKPKDVKGKSRGMVLFGPPGTGKTELTEALPNIMGFHLIEKGLSAADFSKSLVGESSRMIKDLVNRAKLSPHLLCSVGIDEVDGLVPDRKDKDEKNKGEGISMLLSVIGGNKDVPNLVFMTSTNHLNKIDQAIKRRLSGQFQVGRLTPEARKKLILSDLPGLKNNAQILDYMILITSNFTGAALKGLNKEVLLDMQRKKMQNRPLKIVKEEVTESGITIAKQFSINLGIYTLPEIYSERGNKKYVFSKNFLQKIQNQFLLVSKREGSSEFKLNYSTLMEKYQYSPQKKRNQRKYYHEMGEQTLTIGEQEGMIQRQNHISKLAQHIRNYVGNSFRVQQFQCKKGRINEYDQLIYHSFQDTAQPTIMIIEDIVNHEGEILQKYKIFRNPRKNLYVLYFVRIDSFHYMQMLNWEIQKNKPYSGRIFIQLKGQPKMEFELDTPQQQQTKLYFRYFLKGEKQNSPNDIIPELVQFYTQRKVSYILLIDYQLILQNQAYDEQKMFQTIQQKMSQAMNYKNVAVILNVDSLIVLNQSSSDSSMGRSNSYSVSDHNMYRLLLHYMREFAKIQQGTQKWLSVIAKNEELVKILKKDLKWPLTPQQRANNQKQKEQEKERKCIRCGIFYTEKENKAQRKCMQHPGYIIDLEQKRLETVLTLEQARLDELIFKKEKEKDNEYRYVYACCLKGLHEQGHQAYFHIREGQEDDWYNQRQDKQNEWLKICDRLI